MDHTYQLWPLAKWTHHWICQHKIDFHHVTSLWLSVWWDYHVLTKGTCYELCSAVSGTCVFSHPFPPAVGKGLSFCSSPWLSLHCSSLTWLWRFWGRKLGFCTRESIAVTLQTLLRISARSCRAGFTLAGLTVDKVLHKNSETITICAHTVQYILSEAENEMLFILIIPATCSCVCSLLQV